MEWWNLFVVGVVEMVGVCGRGSRSMLEQVAVVRIYANVALLGVVDVVVGLVHKYTSRMVSE